MFRAISGITKKLISLRSIGWCIGAQRRYHKKTEKVSYIIKYDKNVKNDRLEGVTYDDYTIDKKGRVYSVKSQTYAKGKRTTLTKKGKRTIVLIKSIVSSMFMEGKQVWRIKEDHPFPDSVENLTTEKLTETGRPIYQKQGTKVTSWPNISTALKNNPELAGITKATFAYWLKTGKNGWSYDLPTRPTTKGKKLNGYSRYTFYEDG